MTPEDFDPAHPGAQPDETPSDEAVRRLLAAAAGPVTMPPDVTARLDHVLAGLVADRSTADDDAGLAPVIGIEQRRRSRWPKVLVAAALVSVVGVGVANVLNQTGSSISADSATQSKDAQSEGAGSGDTRALGGAEAAPPQDEGVTAGGRGSLADGPPPRLRSSSVTVDAQRIADLTLPLTADATTASPAPCRRPSTSKGDVLVAVRLDGVPATLVFRAEANGRRLTEVFGCDDAESPVQTTTVDVP